MTKKHNNYCIRIYVKAATNGHVRRSGSFFKGIAVSPNKQKAIELLKKQIITANENDLVPVKEEDIVIKECTPHNDFVIKVD